MAPGRISKNLFCVFAVPFLPRLELFLRHRGRNRQETGEQENCLLHSVELISKRGKERKIVPLPLVGETLRD
jgi:hypothetical protein